MAQPRVAQWKNALLDLSLRNRLINSTSRAGYQLAVPGAALGRLEDMINGGAGVTLLASDDVPEIARERGIRFGRDRDEVEREALLADKRQAHLTDVTQAAYTTRLRALAAKAKTVTEETGANNLYLAFGTCAGSSTTVSCNRRSFSCGDPGERVARSVLPSRPR